MNCASAAISASASRHEGALPLLRPHTLGMLDKEAIGDRIGEWASEKGWSLSQLARKAGLANTTVRQMTAGGSMTFENVNATLAALGLSWYDLLDETVGPRERREEETPSIQQTVPAEQWSVVENLVRQHGRQVELLDSKISELQEEAKLTASNWEEFVQRLLVRHGVGPKEAIESIAAITKDMGGSVDQIGSSARRAVQRRIR